MPDIRPTIENDAGPPDFRALAARMESLAQGRRFKHQAELLRGELGRIKGGHYPSEAELSDYLAAPRVLTPTGSQPVQELPLRGVGPAEDDAVFRTKVSRGWFEPPFLERMLRSLQMR